jgi:aminoglycoside phosphotransferase (APT) family kinase protein
MTLDELQCRLGAYIARRDPERSPGLLRPLKRAGGWASNLYTFTLRQADSVPDLATPLVLKMYEPNARGREQATREGRALTHLRGVNYSAPHAWFVEPDARHLGHPFIVMDYIAGRCLWHIFETADSITKSQLTQSFAAQLVALHALDPHLLEPAAGPTNMYGYIEQELEQIRRDSANSPQVVLTGVLRWLEQRKHAVPCQRPVILHRDYHPWNVLVDAAERPWVIDWDWRIGDARFDLAWTCTLMRRSGYLDFGSAVRDEYAEQSGRSLDGLGYFEVLTTVRWLLNVLPSLESNALLDSAAQVSFRKFLIGPVRRAQEFLQERTGAVTTQVG